MCRHIVFSDFINSELVLIIFVISSTDKAVSWLSQHPPFKTMPSDDNRTIRIHVRFDVDSVASSVGVDDSDGEGDSMCCAINASDDLKTMYQDVSSQLGIEIKQLSLIIYQDGYFVATTDIPTPDLLRDQDFVLAIRQCSDNHDDDASNSSSNNDDHGYDNDQELVANSSIVTDSNSTTTSSSARSSPSSIINGATSKSMKKYRDDEDAAAATTTTATRQQGAKTYPLKTNVRKYFGGYGWYNGKIISIDKEKQECEVLYSDGTKIHYAFEDREIHAIVRQYKNRTLDDYRDDDTEDDGYYDDPHVNDGSTKSDDGSDEDYDNMKPRSSKKRKRSNKSSTVPLQGRQFRAKKPLLTDHQRIQLGGIELVIEDFETYLSEERGYNGRASIVNISRPIARLLSGEGIRCPHWPDDVVFHQDKSIDMSDDFCKLWQEAISYELKYGEDKSHGNLLRTPINRLIEYQKYFYDTEFPLLKRAASSLPDTQVNDVRSMQPDNATKATKATATVDSLDCDTQMKDGGPKQADNPTEATKAIATVDLLDSDTDDDEIVVVDKNGTPVAKQGESPASGINVDDPIVID